MSDAEVNSRTCPQGHVGQYKRFGAKQVAMCVSCMQERCMVQHRRVRMRIIHAYGDSCSCCGETEFEFLCIDHVNGSGGAHRKQVHGQYSRLRAIEKAGYPPDYRLLCWNCNHGVRGAQCPHVAPWQPQIETAQQRHRLKIRNELLDAYGAICVCCGETRRDFLGVDHISGGGRVHRLATNPSGVYKQIRYAGYPPIYRLLCHNCNYGAARPGGCPHQR